MSDQHTADRRLHPLGIAFRVVRRLREFVVPFAVAVFASRSERVLAFGAAALGMVAVIGAVWDWLTFRYGYGEDDLVVRSGRVFRNERHIPYSRIQNIDAVQNVAHRFFDVAIVQVQTGSGGEPEATLNLLPLSALAEMRERVFARRAVVAGEIDATGNAREAYAVETASATAERTAPVELLHLAPRELLLAGLIENRGMALILGTIAALSRFDRLEDMVVDRIERWIPAWASVAPDADLATRIGSTALATVVAILVIVLFVRGISALWAMVRLYDFRLVRDGDDLRAEYGMFTRVTSTIPIRRVQTISLHQRWLHRRIGRAAIRVTTAGGGVSGEGGSKGEREWLAPIIPVDQMLPLLRQLDATLSFDALDWHPPHPMAVWRLFRVSTIWTVVLASAAAFVVGWWALALAVALLIRAALRSRSVVRNLGAAMRDGRAYFRLGWLDRITTVIRFERMQSVSLRRTFFDRRTGMATVSADSAGTGSAALRMPYLPYQTADALFDALSREAARKPFTW